MYVDVGCLVRGDRRCGLEFDIQFNVGQEEVGTIREAKRCISHNCGVSLPLATQF